MIISVAELHQQRKSSVQDGKRSDTRAWQVVCDDKNDGTATALFAPSIPRYGDPGAGGTKATSIDASPDSESDVIFIVTVEFTGGDVEEIPVHPLDRPPEFSWNSDSYSEPYYYDESEPRKPFTTSAGDSFENLNERNKSDLAITMVRNEAFWNVLEADAYKDTTNADVVSLDTQLYDVGTLLLGPLTAVKMSEVWLGVTVDYYKVTYNFKARKQGWKDRVLDAGLNQTRERTVNINGVPTLIKERVPIVSATGLAIQKPWPLDGAGKAKPSATDVAAELTFSPYRAVPFFYLSLS